MIVCAIDTSAWVKGTPITLASPIVNTNGSITLNSSNNGLTINTPGWYKVRFQAVVSATTESVGASVYADDTEIALTNVTVTSTAGDDVEIYIEYPIQVKAAESPSVALIQFVPTGAGTPVNGYVFIDRIPE